MSPLAVTQPGAPADWLADRLPEGAEPLLVAEIGPVALGLEEGPPTLGVVIAMPVPWYLSLSEGVDCLEVPAEGDRPALWVREVRGFLRLARRSHPEVYELAKSPRRHLDGGLGGELEALMAAGWSRQAIAGHAFALAKRALPTYFDPRQGGTLVKYLHVVRPLLMVEALRADPAALPPVDLAALLARGVPGADPGLADDLLWLAGQAATPPEARDTARRAGLDRWINDLLDRAEATLAALPAEPPPLEAAETLFRRLIGAAAS
ncbi:DNA polymerase beta superfamily protein [Roseospirillum parvum]|uniref:Predicted nucleotidyltransferase n=1 Tax=Roseospirillum parvum TaxID=83401 RepID=A0A1G7WLW5_9PROT|nr:nucleotidyltransferase domain-containing protein [Roseospirillum parvum]SDG72210.1 Predicted nucleotidyltransferase [Roseospirillum parvum]